MRLLGCVNDFVTTQCGRLSETLAADFAYEGTGSGVNGHMAGEIVMGVKHFAALLAGKGLLFTARSAGTGSRTGAVGG